MGRWTGSSPHVRGTHKGRLPQRDRPRFIPACAGNAGRMRPSGRFQTVHPRMCGERYDGVAMLQLGSGSSPHVRGTPRDAYELADAMRFIPACAGNASATYWPPAISSVHPRMCGERSVSLSTAAVKCGSSPHVRGTREFERPGEWRGRFIPACAGNAKPAGGLHGSAPVHPRMCGERNPTGPMVRPVRGSSPHVRGTLEATPAAQPGARFIPACAGNALPRSKAARCQPVHPRMCGERGSSGLTGSTIRGSSPHVRGTHAGSAVEREISRFIPACAGNASPARPCCCPAPVHPRMCGERAADRAGARGSGGSSPHVRGTRLAVARGGGERRFIPACAGNASMPTPMWPATSVHPRMCGERSRSISIASHSAGSSPHVRGTRRLRHITGRPRRFIPACAGNAAKSSNPMSALPVHPRMCGERGDTLATLAFEIGSSPHVRGTHHRHGHAVAQRRFIPACAGNAPVLAKTRENGTVHPRMCGERRDQHSAGRQPSGSSPHVRGTRRAGDD